MNHAAILQVIGLAALCRLRKAFNQGFLAVAWLPPPNGAAVAG